MVSYHPKALLSIVRDMLHLVVSHYTIALDTVQSWNNKYHRTGDLGKELLQKP